MTGLSCEDCPDECESTDYSVQVSYAKLRDPGNFFYNNLLRKKTAIKPAINKALFKEYETFTKNYFNVDSVDGPPAQVKDPRPESKTCMERTIRNKISKMSYVHVYFKSFGMTKFSRNVVFGWQGDNDNDNDDNDDDNDNNDDDNDDDARSGGFLRGNLRPLLGFQVIMMMMMMMMMMPGLQSAVGR